MTAPPAAADAFALLEPHAGGAPPGPRDWALFVDIDGTLLEIAATPDGVGAGARLKDDLRRLADALGGALALISGRPIRDIDRIFTPLTLPVAGIHGAERRSPDGRCITAVPAMSLDRLRLPVGRLETQFDGVLIEDKGASIAIHYRRVPERESALRAALGTAIAAENGIEMIEGKMVFELRSRGVNKGMAITAFMAEPPFSGRRPVFLGDDVTDEDGFRVVNAAGGASIRVGLTQPSAARYGLPDVTAVHDWLSRLATGLEQQEKKAG